MPLIALMRYVVAASDAAAFHERAREALDALREQPGCRQGHVGRSMDEPEHWVVHTQWESVGAYRRALSSYDVKVRAVQVLSSALDEPTAYEVLVEAGPQGLQDAASDLADDAATAAPRQERAR